MNHRNVFLEVSAMDTHITTAGRILQLLASFARFRTLICNGTTTWFTAGRFSEVSGDLVQFHSLVIHQLVWHLAGQIVSHTDRPTDRQTHTDCLTWWFSADKWRRSSNLDPSVLDHLRQYDELQKSSGLPCCRRRRRCCCCCCWCCCLLMQAEDLKS